MPNMITTEIKEVSAKGLEFIVQEEGLRLSPYLDSVGIATVGVGMTYYPPDKKVKITDPPITKEEALRMFRFVLKTYEKAVWSLTVDTINQNKFDSLVSITYNIGVNAFKSSTLLKRVNTNHNDPSIREAFYMWQNAGKLKGVLLGRRKREANLFFRPV